MSNSADIAIIGGGIIGMACAWELAQQPDAGRIVVFDKSLPGAGTTGGSAGVICLHDMGELYVLFTLIGHARVQNLRDQHGFAFRTWGALHTIYAPGAFPPPPDPYYARFGRDNPLGERCIYHHEILDRDALLTRFPWIKPQAEDGRAVLGGVLHPNQGYVDTYELVALYERLAVATGRVTVLRNTPVLAMTCAGDRVTTLLTRRGPWRVGQVLNAGGPWGAKVAALAGNEVALTPQRIQVCAATGYDDAMGDVPLTGVPDSVDGEGVWCRGEIGGMLLFGQHHHTTTPGFTVDPDAANRVNDPDYPDSVAAVYRRYWQMPRSVFLNGWCCVYGTTADGFPIVSRDTQRTNFYHALGLNGHGMTCHAGVARGVAALMLRDESHIDVTDVLGTPAQLDFSALSADRFARGVQLDFALREEAVRPA